MAIARTRCAHTGHVRRKNVVVDDLAVISGPSWWTVAEVVRAVADTYTTVLTLKMAFG